MRSLLPFVVLAACVDSRSGKRFAEGDEFDPAPTYEQAVRLVAAGCLPRSALFAVEELEQSGVVIDQAGISRDQINHDGLFDLSVEELQDIISQEGIAVDQEGVKAAVIASIRQHRATKPISAELQNLEMRTEAGERAAREADERATAAQVAKEASDRAAAEKAAADAKAEQDARAASRAAAVAGEPAPEVSHAGDHPSGEPPLLEAREAGAASDRYSDTKPAKATTKVK